MNGYTNYRWRGSLSIHRVCSKGGRKLWVAETQIILPNPEYISLTPNHIPKDTDILPIVHQIHKKNLK